MIALLALALAAALPAASAVPARVASLNLASDEVLIEILPAERLVAVTRLVDEPGTSNAAGRAPRSAQRFARIDVERLVALAPDLAVVSEYTDADALRLLAATGIRTHRMTGLDSFPGYRRAILELGRVVGADQAAAALVARYDRVLDDLQGRLAGAPRPRVLYWADGIVPIGAERAFAADPDVVLTGSGTGTAAELRAHPLLSGLRALREGRLLEMPPELLVALSQAAADAAWHLAHRLHPDRVGTARP